MDFNEYKKLSQVEKTNLETSTTNVEDLVTLERLKKQFAEEMNQEIEAFKNDNKKVDQIVESVNLENQETVEKVKVEIGLDEKLKGMDSEAISIQWRFKEEIEDMKRTFSDISKKISKVAAYTVNSAIDMKKINDIRNKIKTENKGVFDAKQELERIKKLPRDEKEQALKSFKEKLSLTYQGIARVQASIIEKVRNNPELSGDEFINTMETAAIEYGLGQELLQKGYQYFRNYQEKHQAVVDFLKENPTGEEAFRSLFLAKPKGVVELSNDPVSIYFICHSEEDYAWIYNQKFLKQDGEDGERQVNVDMNELRSANMSGGVKLNSAIQPQLTGMIGATNGRYGLSEQRRNEVKTHEMQHVWYDVVFDQNEQMNHYVNAFYENKNLSRYLQSTIDIENIEKVRNVAVEYIKTSVEYALSSAKNEILAFLSDGSSSYKILNVLEAYERTTEEDRLYDYLKPLRTLRDNDIQEKINEYSNTENGHVSNIDINETEDQLRENFEYIQKYIDYSIDKYNYTLSSALDAIGQFVRISSKSNTYSRKEIIALLTEVPLDKFPKIVERTLLKKTF